MLLYVHVGTNIACTCCELVVAYPNLNDMNSIQSYFESCPGNETESLLTIEKWYHNGSYPLRTLLTLHSLSMGVSRLSPNL